MKSPRTRRESHRLSLKELVFELTAVVLVGRALYELLFASVDSVIVPFLRGLFSTQQNMLGYIDFGSMPLYAEFNGYMVQYGHVLSVLGTLFLAAVVVVLLVAYARRGNHHDNPAAHVGMSTCPTCLSLIPAAARRCAYCRAHVQPQAAPGDTST